MTFVQVAIPSRSLKHLTVPTIQIDFTACSLATDQNFNINFHSRFSVAPSGAPI